MCVCVCVCTRERHGKHVMNAFDAFEGKHMEEGTMSGISSHLDAAVLVALLSSIVLRPAATSGKNKS